MMKIPKYLVVAGLLLAVSTVAWAVPLIDNDPASPTYGQGWTGPIVIKTFDRSSGTNYSEVLPSGGMVPPQAVPVNALPAPVGQAWAGPGAWTDAAGNVIESGFGIVRVTGIYKGKIDNLGTGIEDYGTDYDLLWSPATDPQSRVLVGTFWGLQDIWVSGSPASQDIYANNLHVAIWEQDAGILTQADWEMGSTDRSPTNPWEYDNIGGYDRASDSIDPNDNASLWLTAQGVAGFFANPAAEYKSNFAGTAVGASGSAQTYMEVADLTGPAPWIGPGKGSFNDYLDSNFFQTGQTTADLYLNMATDLKNPFNLAGPNDWTVGSEDDVVGIVVPEPITVMAVFLGISGLGGYVRKRTRV